MSRHGRPRLVGLSVILLAAVVCAAPDTSLARLTDSAASTQALGTDTLDPPTGLSAAGGSSASLSWTATVDTYAAGYEVWRATISGGPYSLVSTVTPRTTTPTTNNPAATGPYYHRLRSTVQNVKSTNGHQPPT